MQLKINPISLYFEYAFCKVLNDLAIYTEFLLNGAGLGVEDLTENNATIPVCVQFPF